MLIDSNTFIGHADSGIGFSSTSAAAPATFISISNNNVFDANGRALYAFSLTSSVIISNTITNSTDSATADLRFFEGANGLTIERNVLQNGTGRAFRVNDIGTGLPTATNITFQLNSVSGYTGPVGAFQVDGGEYTGSLDATCNWWGDITGPTIASNRVGQGRIARSLAAQQVNGSPQSVATSRLEFKSGRPDEY